MYNQETLMDNVSTVTGLAVLARTADTTGSAVDVTDFKGQIKMLVVAAAATAGTTPTATYKLTHCATSGGTYTDVSGASVTIDGAAAGVNSVNVDKRALLKYVKVDFNISGADANIASGVFLLGEKTAR